VEARKLCSNTYATRLLPGDLEAASRGTTEVLPLTGLSVK
jgi:hypothetical protein